MEGKALVVLSLHVKQLEEERAEEALTQCSSPWENHWKIADSDKIKV